MMATTSYWTPEVLGELVWALQITLGQVPLEDMRDTPAAQLWTTASDWLSTAEQALKEPDADAHLARLPRFPLSGPQVRELQETVDRLARSRAARQPEGQPVR